MERSTELVAVVGRLFAAINARDLATLANLHADSVGVRFVGTDPDEWWASYQEIMGVFEVQLGELHTGGVTFDVGDIDAYSEGAIGWAACRPTLRFTDGTSSALRWTGVLRLDRGIWRCVQWHLSAGMVNEELLGFEMTTTIESIAAAVREERPDLSVFAGRDGTVTIAFSDLESSTEAAVRLGDVRWLEMLAWHDSVVAGLVTREGGQVVKSLGDGHMLAFSSASAALRAATGIQESFREPHDGESLRLRIGVHTGEVLRRADDFSGRAVITAARVAAAALGTEILTSAMVVDLTRDQRGFQFGEPRLVELKGIPGTHKLFPLLWDRGHISKPEDGTTA
jgi:class 3 adenylate cyclase